MHHHHLMGGWARLHESVQSGLPVRERRHIGDLLQGLARALRHPRLFTAVAGLLAGSVTGEGCQVPISRTAFRQVARLWYQP